MVQVIGQGRTKPLSKKQQNFQQLGQAVETGKQYLQNYQQKQQQQQQMQQENEAVKQNLGLDLSGITDPETRNKLIVEGLKGQQDFKRQSEIEKLKGNIAKENFGEKFNQQYQAKYNAQKKMMNDLGLDKPYDYQGQNNIQPNSSQPIRNTEQEMADYLLGFSDQEPGAQQISQPKKEYRPMIPQQKIDAMGQINPQEASRMQRYNDSIREEMRHDQSLSQQKEKFEYQKQKESPESLREHELSKQQASVDVKYNQEIQANAKQHELKKHALDRLETLNKKGVTGKPYEKALEKFGLVSLTSEGRREFAAETKNLITDIRSILGAQFSQFEFQTILNAYPSADFSKEANNAIIKNLKDFQDIKSKEVEFANQLKKQNGNKIPFDFQTKVNEKVNEYAQRKVPEIRKNTQRIMSEQYGIPKGSTLLLDPNGESLSVPNDQVDELINAGAQYP